jgi:uncharacterized membrane protein
MSGRRACIDWARGIAVLLMIEAHTADAWTRYADRGSTVFGWLTIIGGFAAPFFLWLAGVGVTIAAARTAVRTGSRREAAEAICRRGLEIFILAFLFRLQAFIISPGSHPVTLFRVDILNVMGPSIAAAGILWALPAGAAMRIITLASAAAAIAMMTPLVRGASSLDLLPTWVQWYLRPSGEHTTFTLLPWSGFVFAGSAAGVLIAEPRDAMLEGRATLGVGFGGAALIALGFYAATLPTIYTASSFWTSSPTWFAIRLGIVMACFSLLALLDTSARSVILSRVLAPLARVGRASLFVYWIHVELVYGYASWLWRHRLPVWLTVCAYALFSTLMYAAVVARDQYRLRKSISFPRSAPLPQA